MADMTIDQQQIQRRQALADMLRQQAMTPDQTQMAGGWVVPYSPWQGLAKLGQGYFAGEMQKDIDKQQQELEAKKQQKITEALKNYGKTTIQEPYVETDPYTGKPLYSSVEKQIQATPEQQLTQDWQLSQLDPSFAKVLEARRTLEDQQKARLEQIQLQRDLMRQQQLANEKPYFTPLQTTKGIYSFNARTGKAELMPDTGGEGSPLINPQFSPSLQADIAGAKAGAQEMSKAKVEAQVKLPQVVETAQELSRHIDQLIGSRTGDIPPHPGLSSYLSTSGAAGLVPKTSAADFKARLDQLQGGGFLQAYNTLRGGGQITEIEGKKATDALNRARAATKEADFVDALRDFQDVVNRGSERARRAAQGNFTPAAPAAPSLKVIDFGSL